MSSNDQIEKRHSEDSRDEHMMSQLEIALLEKDFSRALAIISKFQLVSQIPGKDVSALLMRIQQAQDNLEEIENMYKSGVRALVNEDPELAFECFSNIVKMLPDHAEARAGMQGARRYQERRDQIGVYLDEAHDARCRGDFETARERCRDVLHLAPDNEAALNYLSEIDEWIIKRRRAQSLIQEGNMLFGERRYHEAWKVWERISDIEPSFTDGVDLIKKAKQAIWLQEREDDGARLLVEAQRQLDIGRFHAALQILSSFPEDTSLSVDAAVLRRKAQNGIDQSVLVTDLERKIMNAMNLGDRHSAEQLITVLRQLVPDSKLIDQMKDTFSDLILPEKYEA